MNPAGEGRPQKEDRLGATVRSLLARPDFPAFSEHIQKVMESAGDQEQSLRHVTNLILRDLGLTAKVLRSANSSAYNRSGRPILSVAHAVAMLGLESIRNLAGSLLLFDRFHRSSPGLKELMMLSLLTAHHASQAAERLNYPFREEAYLCGMFRNLGEVLVACFLPREYAQILVRMGEEHQREKEACAGVLGFSYEALGEAIANHWQMPKAVGRSILAPVPTTRPRGHTEMLEAITGFSAGLTSAVYRQDARSTPTRIRLLLDTYAPVLGFREEDVKQMIEQALAEARETLALLRVPVDDLRLRRQMEAALSVSQTETERDVLADLTHEVEILMESSPAPDLHAIILMVLEAIFRGGPFERVAFCLVNPEGNTIEGRLGLGEDIDALLEKFRFPLSLRGGPVAAALLLRQDLFVATAREGRHQDSEFASVLGGQCFGLLPVVAGRVVLGCLYFDRLSPAQPFTEHARSLLKRLRDLTAAALQRRRTKPA